MVFSQERFFFFKKKKKNTNVSIFHFFFWRKKIKNESEKEKQKQKMKNENCQRNSMFLTHSASRSNSVVWRLIQSCHVFFCAARDDRRLVVESLLCVSAVVPFSVILRVDAHSAMAQGKRVSLAVIHTTRCLVVFGVFFISPCLDMYHGSGDSLVWRWILRCMNLWLVLWTRQDLVRFYVSSVYLVINTELCLSTEYRIWTQISRVHSPVVKAADCRSAGPWFKSGWKTLFTFVTWYDKLTNHDFLMINIMSPITTSIRTITRKSVNMVAELDNGTALWTVCGIGHSLEGNPVVTKVLYAIALKTPSRYGAYAVVDWMQWSRVPILAGGPTAGRMSGRLIGESLDRLGNPTFRLGLHTQVQTQEQHIQLHEDQLTTDTADLKTTEEALAEDTAAFEDITQDCLVCQTKFVEFKAYSKSLSEGLETFAKAKAVIYEKTGDAEYQDEDGWVFGVEAHEGAISDQFVGATEVSNHGKPGTRVELMVDSGSTATVCGLEYLSDTLVTVGPPMRLRASNGQPLKHYGQKKVELLSDGGEKMHVTFSVHDVKRAMISTSATAPSGIETHLGEWNPQGGLTVSYFKKRTSGGTRWLNMMTRGGLYFLGATVANGQLQQPGADPKSCGYEYNFTFPTWRTIGDVAPVDGEQDRVTFPTWRTSGDVAPVDGDEDMAQAAKVADGAASVEVAADGNRANNQSPEADGWSNDNVSLAPTDPKGPPMSVGQWAQQSEPTEAEKIAQVGATKATRAWTRRLRAWTWPDCVRRCAVMTLTEHGRTMLRETQCQSLNAIISSSKQRRRTFCARQLAQLIRCTTARWRWSVSSKA